MTQQTYTPDWSKAPNDANWHARDSDGCGFWYNKRPAPSRGFWAVGRSLTVADNDCPVLDHDAALDNWRDTLTVRPFQDRDIPQNLSDYFTGKTSFVTAYVDLLLARMSFNERFSCEESIQCPDIKEFDVITFPSYENNKVYAVVSSAAYYKSVTPVLCVSFGAFLEYGKWECAGNEAVNIEANPDMRTITELEATQFRVAMEAVYG